MKDEEKKLIYCATPSRIKSKTREIMDFVTSRGCGPLHPFQAYPIERFENGPIGREKTMDFCLRLIDVCDEFWMFGISVGTLTELNHILEYNEKAKLKNKPIKFFLDYDNNWKIEYEKLKEKFEDPLKKLDIFL